MSTRPEVHCNAAVTRLVLPADEKVKMECSYTRSAKPQKMFRVSWLLSWASKQLPVDVATTIARCGHTPTLDADTFRMELSATHLLQYPQHKGFMLGCLVMLFTVQFLHMSHATEVD